jgi:transposase
MLEETELWEANMQWRKRDRTVWDEVLFDQTVPEEHRLRKVDATLDLTFINDMCSDVYAACGRPAEEPEHLFRMYLLMFLENIPFETVLARQVNETPAYRWFCGFGFGDSVPDHSSLYVFRHRLEARRFSAIFAAVVQQCQQRGLVHNERWYVDPTDVRASATPYSSYQKALALAWVLQAYVAGHEAELASLVQQKAKDLPTFIAQLACEALQFKRTHMIQRRLPNLRLERTSVAGLRPLLMSLVATARAQGTPTDWSWETLQKQVQAWLGYLPGGRGDPDAHLARTTDQQLFLGYWGTLMVDATYEIIVAAELFTTHKAQPPTFLPTYQRAKDIIGQHPRALGADAVFDTVAIARALADDGVNVFIPVWRRPGPSADLFGQERFTLHDDGSVTCPAEQPMTFLYQRSYDAARVFRGQGCPTCPLRSQCTRAKGDRKIYLHPEQWRQRQAQRAKCQTPEHRAVMKDRFATIEPAIGHSKTYHQLGKAHYRSLPMNQIGFLMAAMSINIEKVVRYRDVSLGQAMLSTN